MTDNNREYPLPPATSHEPARTEVDRLLAELQNADYERYPALNSGTAGCLVLCAGMFALIGTAGMNSPLLSFLVLIAVFAACWRVMRNRASILQKKRATLQIINELLDHDDVRIIAPLLSVLEWLDAALYADLFRQALTRLLPQIKASDMVLLSRRQRIVLHFELDQPDIEYRCAILKALEELGDNTSVPYVRHFAESPLGTADSNRVKQAAGECLQILLARTERKQSKARLLRPAEGDRAHTLLHPLNTHESEDVERLLRPGHAEQPIASPDKNRDEQP